MQIAATKTAIPTHQQTFLDQHFLYMQPILQGEPQEDFQLSRTFFIKEIIDRCNFKLDLFLIFFGIFPIKREPKFKY